MRAATRMSRDPITATPAVDGGYRTGSRERPALAGKLFERSEEGRPTRKHSVGVATCGTFDCGDEAVIGNDFPWEVEEDLRLCCSELGRNEIRGGRPGGPPNHTIEQRLVSVIRLPSRRTTAPRAAKWALVGEPILQERSMGEHDRLASRTRERDVRQP